MQERRKIRLILQEKCNTDPLGWFLRTELRLIARDQKKISLVRRWFDGVAEVNPKVFDVEEIICPFFKGD